MSRPNIPKRLASRLTAVYAKVADARRYLSFAEAKILDCTLHVQEFKTDPAAFTGLHYPSTDGPDSYPVRTNIARALEEIERKTDRMPIYLQAVAEAEAKVALVEKEVLETLAAMRQDTPGRVAWPPEPSSLERLRAADLKEFRLNRERTHRNLLRQNQKRESEAARAREEAEAFERETDRLIEENLSHMPADKASVYRSVFAALKCARASGVFGEAQIQALAGGDHTAFEPIIDSAKKLLEQEMETRDGTSASGA